MDACCLCSVERAFSPRRLLQASQLVLIVTCEMMMEIYTSAQTHYLSEQGWLQGCVAMHVHVLRHLCFVWSFIVFEQGRGELATSSSYPVVVVVLHRLRSSIIIYLSVDSSLTTWLVSDKSKHARCRCEQSLSILISLPSGSQSP